MKNRLRVIAALLALAGSMSAFAHEFWLWPKPFQVAAGGSTRLSIYVGEYFAGDLTAFSPALVAGLRIYSDGAVQDLLERITGKVTLPELPLSFKRAGTYMVAFDSHPSRITMPADKFHAYLHDEGLDAIAKQRELAGTAKAPARERFRRNVKTLVRVGGRSDATYAARTGQRLEIVPLSDPLSSTGGPDLNFSLIFDGKPLADALVKAWHRHDLQTLAIRARSDINGKVTFSLPYAGPWMISAVHMIPATDSDDVEWDSFWGNLTFELPARGRR